MCYRILIRQQARCALQALTRHERVLLTEKILLLGNNPFDERMRVRRLPGAGCFRLRSGVFSVIYTAGEKVLRIMSIEKIQLTEY